MIAMLQGRIQDFRKGGALSFKLLINNSIQHMLGAVATNKILLATINKL